MCKCVRFGKKVRGVKVLRIRGYGRRRVRRGGRGFIR